MTLLRVEIQQLGWEDTCHVCCCSRTVTEAFVPQDTDGGDSPSCGQVQTVIRSTASCPLDRQHRAELKRNLIRLIAGTGKNLAWPGANSHNQSQYHSCTHCMERPGWMQKGGSS